ncbi:hypothetical protein B0T25DRAFT_606774, partial [Lasiosphaeria hispida]
RRTCHSLLCCYSPFLSLDRPLFSQSLLPSPTMTFTAAQIAQQNNMQTMQQNTMLMHRQTQISLEQAHRASIIARNAFTPAAPPPPVSRSLRYDEMLPQNRRSSDEAYHGWNPFAKKKPSPASTKEATRSPAPPCMATTTTTTTSPPKPPTLRHSRASTSSLNSEDATLRSSLRDFRFPDSDGPRDSIPSKPATRGQHIELPPPTDPAATTTLTATTTAPSQPNNEPTPTPTASSRRSKGSKRAKARKTPAKVVKKLRELGQRLRKRLSRGKSRVKDKVKAKKPSGLLKLRG